MEEYLQLNRANWDERALVHAASGGYVLARYVADQRVRTPVCLGCPHAAFCGGFLDAKDAPEPSWVAQPVD